MKKDVYDEPSATMGSRARGGVGSSKPEGDKAEMMKKMEEAGRPGAGHKALEPLVGDWNAEVKCWMDPGGAPEVTHGTAHAKWKFRGRFLEEEFHGEMMGKSFTGQTLMGFDNVRQTFNCVWISDTQTSIFTSEGRVDSANKVITSEGKASCAATGRKEIPMKTILRILSPDKHVLEMFDGSQGNAKTMEITYTRK